MAVVLGDIGNDDTGALDVGRLEVLEQIVLVPLVRGHTVVTDEGLGKDQDLTSVGRVGHGLGVANEGRSEDGFARDISIGAEGFALKYRAILHTVSVPRPSDFYRLLTLMVKVAGVESTLAVPDLGWVGISLPLLPDWA